MLSSIAKGFEVDQMGSIGFTESYDVFCEPDSCRF